MQKLVFGLIFKAFFLQIGFAVERIVYDSLCFPIFKDKQPQKKYNDQNN